MANHPQKNPNKHFNSYSDRPSDIRRNAGRESRTDTENREVRIIAHNKEKSSQAKEDLRDDTDDSAMISIPIPSRILKDRSVSVLEAIVEYMKDDLELTLHDIAKLISRDDRTIWTCYSRAKKKRGIRC